MAFLFGLAAICFVVCAGGILVAAINLVFALVGGAMTILSSLADVAAAWGDERAAARRLREGE